MHDPLNKLERLCPKGEIDAFIGPEKICNDGKGRSFYIGEQQSFALALDNTPMYLGDLEVRVYFGLDLDQLALSSEQVDKGSEVLMHLLRNGPQNGETRLKA